MVMHASKYPRLNDGYYERTKSHQYEDKYPSKSHGYDDRYRDGRRKEARDQSPMRVQKNYADDKTRQKSQSGPSRSPGDRKSNHNSNLDAERHYNSKMVKPKDGKDKPDIQKSALRICGDWSEHLSSKGKRYYYNIKTEVSRWEKPKEWNDSMARHTEYGIAKERQNGREHSKHHSSKNERVRHSSIEQRDSQQRLAKSFSTPINTLSSTSSQHHSSVRSNSAYSSSAHKLQKDQDRGHSSRPNISSVSNWHGMSSAADGGGKEQDRERRSDPMSVPKFAGYEHRNSTSSSRTQDDTRYHRRKDINSGNHTNSHSDVVYNGSRHLDVHRNDHEDSRQTEDMEISPCSTPSNSRPASRASSRISTPGPQPLPTTPKHGLNMCPIGSSTMLVSDRSPRTTTQDGQNLTQTIQQLQILQKVLMVQQQLQKQQKQNQQHNLHEQQSNKRLESHPPTCGDQSPQSEGTPTYEPHHMPPWENAGSVEVTRNDHDHTHQSPKSDSSIKSSRRASPNCSDGSSQAGLQVGTSSLSAATKKNSSALNLTPSLSNYYKENLVEHVQGWPSDSAERQANHYAEEAHLVGSQHCTQVSVELKKARSLVRIAEIQATLQEQRVLFLKQQIADLERSQNSYMPPSSDS